MNTIFVTVSAIFIAGGAYLFRRTRAKQTLTHLSSRESMSDDEIYTQFYATRNLDRSAVLLLWKEIAETLRVPADRMRPSDRFGKEIGTFFITSEDLDALSALAARHAKKRGVTMNLSSITTVDEYIEAFASKLG